MAIKVATNNKSTWLRPWNIEKFDNLYNRDERYFSVLFKGLLSWLNRNIILYNKPITHFIFNTGSSYFYVESNGYEFSMNETSGEDAIYMKMPRCIVEIDDIQIPMEELSAPYVRGVYERLDGNTIKGYNAQIQRLPIEMTISARYVLSNFNEAIVLIQELIDKVAFQQYFNITYLGQIINCSLEIDNNFKIDFVKVDMTGTDTNQKTIELVYKVCSNYPVINERTEVENKKVIETLSLNTNIFNGKINNRVDTETIDNIVNTNYIYNNATEDDLGNNISFPSDNKTKNDTVYGDSSWNDAINNTPASYTSYSYYMNIDNNGGSDNGNIDNTIGHVVDDIGTHILEYDNNDLIKTTFGELKNKI